MGNEYDPEPRKQLIALLNAGIPSINCEGDESSDLYIIKSPLHFKPFISKLLQKHSSTIVIQYKSIKAISELFHSFFQTSPSEEDNFSLGHSITIVVDPEQLSELSVDSTKLIQILRIISLKHGCSIISIKNLNNVTDIKNIDKLIKLEKQDVKPNFEDLSINEDDLLLYIPSTWDSWNKIILHGNSTILGDDENNDGIIRNEQDLRNIDEKYEDYLTNDDPNKDWLS
ncbi:uncharacterized protein KGF55_001809 [Candida pseudojiufengensis]|uniref:uncharacterized protein n=1 Tax=Candida pseudojiufengensis TaxID=497109 RepID=UPI0022253EBC|nr:uncharacterized protein KGF55_001809 [Candida pseudojiufengensis]KAI5964739.1 hypothetical protein KGF55_001809 [Candida pseudojiufengensis]